MLFPLLTTRQLGGWGRVVKVLHIYKGFTQKRTLRSRNRDRAQPWWQGHTRAGHQLLLLTQITLHSLTAQLHFFFPPNDIFSVFFFCASLNKRHTFTLAIGFDEWSACQLPRNPKDTSVCYIGFEDFYAWSFFKQKRKRFHRFIITLE